MSAKSLQTLLQESFPATGAKDWTQIASKEIEGKDPSEALQWKTADGDAFDAYYDRETIRDLAYLDAFERKPDEVFHAGGRWWTNCPKILVKDPAVANELALYYLNHGADGLCFTIDDTEWLNFDILLKNIQWEYCHLAFEADATTASRLADYIHKSNFAPSTINGAFFGESTAADKENIERLSGQPKFFTHGLKIVRSTPAKEIAAALTSAVKCIDSLISAGVGAENAIRRVAFSIPAAPDFLITIAKTKALRILWFQVAQAYGVKQFHPQQLHIHGRCEPWVEDAYQPHSTMLNSTTAAVACILGGCDSITIQPEQDDNATMRRIAVNVLNILREESHLHRVADPIAGAYSVKGITDGIARRAWQEFVAASNH